MIAEKIDPIFFLFLSQFQRDFSISAAVDNVLHSANKRDYSTLESSLSDWVQSAVQNGWFKGV